MNKHLRKAGETAAMKKKKAAKCRLEKVRAKALAKKTAPKKKKRARKAKKEAK